MLAVMDKSERERNEAQVSELISQAIKDDMEDMDPVTITKEELYALAWRDRLKKRSRRMKYIGTAAAILLVFGVVAYIAWPTIFPSVDADKNDKQVAQEKENKVVINDEVGDAEDTNNVKTISKWSQVQQYSEKYSGLYVPTFIPSEYNFKGLSITEVTEDEYIFDYRFENNEKDILNINQWKQDTTVINDHVETIIVGSKKVYITEINQKGLTASLFLKKQVITLSGGISRKELIEIVNGIK